MRHSQGANNPMGTFKKLQQKTNVPKKIKPSLGKKIATIELFRPCKLSK
jgi:hypothetical protein